MPTWLEIALRSIVLVAILFFLTKWLGKKQLSEMSVFEYISGIVLGSIAAIFSFDLRLNLLYGFISMFIWFLIPFLVEYVSLKSKTFRDFTQGKSAVLIQNGKILEDNLKKERVSADELLERLRDKNIFRVADVEFASLEPSGRLSVLPKKETTPITPKTLNWKVGQETAPETVIMDGEILLEPLANLKLSTNWLLTELEKQNATLANVFLAQVDSDGQLTLDLYDDQLKVANPTEKPLLMASLKKCQADLELFALATQNEQARNMYEQNSKKLEKVIKRIEPYTK